MIGAHTTDRFPFRFADSYLRAARAFGIGPERASVEVTDAQFAAHFGRWAVRTPLANIARVELTGPYRFLKTAGPPRMGITDLGLTFASNGDRGVELHFHSRVRGISARGPITHGELTVTVAEPEALAALLEQRIQLR